MLFRRSYNRYRRKMFGFGKGKLEVSLSTKNVDYGGIIDGTASLELKEPQQARGFIIEVLAIKERPSNDDYSDVKDTDILFRASQPLMGEGQYTTQPYQFSFKIQIPQESQIPGARVGTLGRIFGGVRVKWYINAKLDIPGGRDVSKKVEIKVG